MGKSPAAHTALLQQCWEEHIDVILTQEPSVTNDGPNRFSSHPGYDAFVPVDNWDGIATQPRVITYVRKSSRLKTRQKRPWRSRDLLWLEVDHFTIINVYKPPHEPLSEATRLLLGLRPPLNCVVAGDFNAWYNAWDPEVPQTRNAGLEIHDWAVANGLSCIGEIGVPTHAAGRTIDLSFSNIPFALAKVDEKIQTGADHKTLRILIPRGGHISGTQYRYSVPDNKLGAFTGVVELGVQHLTPLPEITTPEQVDQRTREILDILRKALETIGKQPVKDGCDAPWWTDACREARDALHRARKHNPGDWRGLEERKHFLTVVRREKREYWRQKIDSIQSDKDLYEIVKWHKLQPAIRAPPLVVGDRRIEDTEEKAHALRKALLERFTDAEDLEVDPMEVPVVPRHSLPWDAHISEEELTAATVTVRSTSPGADGISVRLLKACWHIIQEPVRALFQACLRTGHHPRPFRTAEVVMLRKPNKKDFSNPRSWRPIALLSCLGKGLERLVARRIANTALLHGVVSPQQAGALPTRAASDLLACLTHEIKHALENRGTASILTADVMGAFDAALRKRLMLRMRQQGWPSHLVRFIGSFMEERQVRIRLEDVITTPQRIQCGLPQGSPASPVLFLLYIADILLEDTKYRFGYADDICLYRTGKSL